MDKKKAFLWEFFIEHRKFTIIIVVALFLLGLVSIIQLPKESNPEIDVPIGVVTTIFPGASAEDVEELVTNIIEDKVLNISEVDKVTSTSREGVSSVVVEFDADADSDQKILDLKEKVDEAKANLPDEAEDPSVIKIRFSDEPIYTFAIGGPYDLSQLKQFAEDLKENIEHISGVSEVEISGDQDREIQVLVDKSALDRFGIGISQVTGAIAGANTDIPTGSIETAGAKYNLRLAGRLFTARDVELVPITSVNGVPILIGDVARVVDGFSEKTTISRLSIGGEGAVPSLSLQVFKVSGGNIIDVVTRVEEEINTYRETSLPQGVSFEVIRNDAEFIKEDLNNLTTNGLQTVVIVMLLLLVFLGWRESVLAGFAIPMSFLITFMFLLAVGSTINFLSLFSLILALGILIDSAIVVVENMHRNIKSGMNGTEAARRTIREFTLPLLAGVLTTIFAFLPMLLMSGIMGQFVKHIPITVTIVLLSSIVVALGFVTTLGVTWLKKEEKRETRIEKYLAQYVPRHFANREAFFEHMNISYGVVLKKFLSDTRRRKIFVRSLFVAFFVSLSLPIMGLLTVNMFPNENEEFMTIDIKKPVGTPLEETDLVVRNIENELYGDGNIKSFVTTIGRSGPLNENGGSGDHWAHIAINLKDKDERDVSSVDLVDMYQKELPALVNADISVMQIGAGPPSGAPIEITVSGKDLEVIEEITLDLESILKQVPGASDVRTTIEETSGEFVLSIDRAKAQVYGVSTIQLAQVLRNAISGTDATVIRKDGDEIDVLVKYALDPETVIDGKTNIIDLSAIESLTITTPVGQVPIGTFIDTKLSGSRPSIQHENGTRVLKIRSFVTKDSSAAEVFGEFSKRLDGVVIPDGYTVSLGGEREDITQSYTDMFRAMILAVFLIAASLVLQFNSYRQPLFILVTIPLALIGVFPGLMLVGKPLSFPGIIGVVALVGIVVNNAIILIDRINRNRLEGMSKEDAVVNASKTRLEPIILTTITTVLGILPITLSNPLWGPLGYAIIFGLSFSTITTLFVVPLLYLKYGESELGGTKQKPASL